MADRRVVDEAAFLKELRQAISDFSFEQLSVKDGSFRWKAPGHTAILEGGRPRTGILAGRRPRAGYEPSVSAVIGFLIRTFDVRTVYDVGAARGFFALLAASTEGRSVTACAFEMRPSEHRKMLEQIAQNPELQGRVRAYLSGMSDHHEGERTIWFSRTRMFEQKPLPQEYREAWWIRLKFFLRGLRNRDELISAKVLVTSVDHFAADEARNPDLIKIDVDGYEALVVPGAMKTLTAARPFLLLELHKDTFLRRFGKTRRDVVRPLFEIGYSAVLIEEHNAAASDISEVRLHDAAIDRQKTSMFLFY